MKILFLKFENDFKLSMKINLAREDVVFKLLGFEKHADKMNLKKISIPIFALFNLNFEQ